MNAIEPYLIKVALRILLVISNWAFGHKELTPMICLIDHQTIASQSAIGQCPKQPSLIQVYMYKAISRNVVGKSARDKPERYCGWF